MPKKKGSIFDQPKGEKEEFIDEPNEFLEDKEHPGTAEDFTTKLQVGDKETDIYTEEGREELEEDEGEIAPWEEGFAKVLRAPKAAIALTATSLWATGKKA